MCLILRHERLEAGGEALTTIDEVCAIELEARGGGGCFLNSKLKYLSSETLFLC